MNEREQKAFDDLAGRTAAFAHQILLGSHMPTRMQWLELAAALRGAVPHLTADAFLANIDFVARLPVLIEAEMSKGIDPREAYKPGRITRTD